MPPPLHYAADIHADVTALLLPRHIRAGATPPWRLRAFTLPAMLKVHIDVAACLLALRLRYEQTAHDMIAADFCLLCHTDAVFAMLTPFQSLHARDDLVVDAVTDEPQVR